MPDLSKLYDAILSGDHRAAIAITRDAIDARIDAMEMVTGYMVPAMDEVGRRFECEEYFVPELLLCGRAMKSALELLRPLGVLNGGIEPRFRQLDDEHHGFRERVLLDGVFEKELACRLYALRVVAEGHFIEVHLQDFLFGVPALHLHRPPQLDELAPDGDV